MITSIQEQAGRRVGVSQQAVSKLLKHWHETQSIEEHHGGGRQHSWNQQQMQYLESLISETPNAYAAFFQALMPPDTPQVTERTIQRYRRELGWGPRTQPIQHIDT